MFDQVTGLPVHVLVNHAVVVLVPLTVLGALVFALVPRWRWLTRWPVLVGAVISLASAYVAEESGEAFFERLGEPAFVEPHKENGELLFWVLVGLLVVVAAAFFLLGGERTRTGAAKPIQLVVAVVLVVAAVGAGVQVVRTGDSGARAVWEQTG